MKEPKHLLGHADIIANKNVLYLDFLRYGMFWVSEGYRRSFAAGNVLRPIGINSSFYIAISLLTNM